MDVYRGRPVGSLTTTQVADIKKHVGTAIFSNQNPGFYQQLVQIGTPKGNVHVRRGKTSATNPRAQHHVYRAAERLYQEAQAIDAEEKWAADEAEVLRELDDSRLESCVDPLREAAFEGIDHADRPYMDQKVTQGLRIFRPSD
jgi:hypothetical protein